MLNSNTVLWATASSAERKSLKHTHPGTDKSLQKETREVQVQLNACEQTIPQWVMELHISYAQLPLCTPACRLVHFPSLPILRNMTLEIPNLPELLIQMSSRHQGFKQVKGLFYLILLTWNWYFAADDFSSPEYFPGKFWRAAGELCSTREGRGDLCLAYRKEMLIKGFKWGWSLWSCQIKKMEGNTGACAKGLFFAVKQPDIGSGFKYW